jgi:uncharacterized membrane protein
VTVARRATTVELDPEEAFRLWTDVRRWPTFVDGFGHVEEIAGDWPAHGAKVVWRSIPTGRGRVTERVAECVPGERVATQVVEERLSGTQTASFAALDGGGSEVRLELEYELTGGGPLRVVTDLLFIRRAQNDALARTLRRFATEAAEESAL